MTIGERIKEVRKRAGFRQSDLADRIDVSKQTMYKYETGIVTNIPSDKIAKIAQETGTSPAYLMGWTDSPYKETRPVASLMTHHIKLEQYFNKLNEEGQDKVISYAADLAENPKYVDGRPYDIAEAAHLRGDIEITEAQAAHDSAIMLDDKEWGSNEKLKARKDTGKR